MKRPLGMTLLVLLVSLVRPAPASAGFWAWLEEWSGPGPFRAEPGQTWLFTYCVQDKSWKPSPISNRDLFHGEMANRAELLKDAIGVKSFSDSYRRVLANPTLWDMEIQKLPTVDVKRLTGNKVTTKDFEQFEKVLAPVYANESRREGPGHKDRAFVCGYADVARFSADAGGGFPQLTATSIDAGPSARLHDGVDVGVGIGRIVFRGSGVKQGYTTLTPIRLVLRPILLALPEEKRRAWMGFFNIYWKETYVEGLIKAADLGAPSSDWSVDGELIRSFGFNIDVGALFPTNWHMRPKKD
jgi:hypothetical protein